jgi:hypothetical protein
MSELGLEPARGLKAKLEQLPSSFFTISKEAVAAVLSNENDLNGKVPVVGDSNICPSQSKTGESSKVVGLKPGGIEKKGDLGIGREEGGIVLNLAVFSFGGSPPLAARRSAKLFPPLPMLFTPPPVPNSNFGSSAPQIRPSPLLPANSSEKDLEFMSKS